MVCGATVKSYTHCAVSNNGFLVDLFGLVKFYQLFGLGSLLLCPFHKKLRILRKKSLGFAKQIIRDLVSSCLLLYIIDNLLGEIWKLVNSVSFVSQQRGSPWLSAFEIFDNNICSLV